MCDASVCVCVCVCVCVFIELHIAAQCGPVILLILLVSFYATRVAPPKGYYY